MFRCQKKSQLKEIFTVKKYSKSIYDFESLFGFSRNLFFSTLNLVQHSTCDAFLHRLANIAGMSGEVGGSTHVAILRTTQPTYENAKVGLLY